MNQLTPEFYNSPLAQAIREYAASGRKDSQEIKVSATDPWFNALPDGHEADDGELYVTVWRGSKGGLACNLIDPDELGMIVS